MERTIHTRNLHPLMYTSISHIRCPRRRGRAVATRAVSWTATNDGARNVWRNVSPIVALFASACRIL